MSLNTESVKQTVNQLLSGIEAKVNNGVKIVELQEEHTAIYKNILTESLASNDKDEILNYLSWLLFAGGLQNFNFAKAHDALSNIIPIVNNLEVLVKGQPVLVAEIQKLQSIIGKTNEGRSRGGKNKDKAKQDSMQEIERTYLYKHNSGFEFKEGRLTAFYKDMATGHNLDFSSVKNRVEKLRKKLGHTARPKRQSS
ncbi:MAG: hypothetical protein Q7U33_09895 [Methylotenera sp.]|uniref:hypothetical protein n=1 Tax=Methylotenera sp. TaxID=2051956 RepID=UPI002717F744|nr:hypothetical protein [Methylotenera sp.]MDO9151676.1 hypothetical protein [Methylotenera sp.]